MAKVLKELTSLKHLDLFMSEVSDDVLPQICSLKELTSLQIPGYNPWSGNEIACILNSCKSLRGVDLGGDCLPKGFIVNIFSGAKSGNNETIVDATKLTPEELQTALQGWC